MPFAGCGLSAVKQRAYCRVAGTLAAAFKAAQQRFVHGVIGFQRHGVFDVHRHKHERDRIAWSVHRTEHGHFHVHFLRYHAQLCGRAVTVGDVENRAVSDIVLPLKLPSIDISMCRSETYIHRPCAYGRPLP